MTVFLAFMVISIVERLVLALCVFEFEYDIPSRIVVSGVAVVQRPVVRVF